MAGDVDSVASRSTAAGSEEETERGTWVGRLDFLLSCIGYAVGLGNIWRFPYLCYRNGGAVFLIPYIFFLVMCGMPLFFIEVTYGQFASLSPITVWRISPLFKGIGWGMVIICGIVCIYYNIIITWTLYYLFKSFQARLPWASCGNAWNDEHCALNVRAPLNNSATSDSSSRLLVNGTFELLGERNGIGAGGGGAGAGGALGANATEARFNLGMNISAAVVHRVAASEQYWENHVLDITKGIENMGSIRLELLGCLVLAWVLVFCCLCKGIKSSGRVVYVTATFPYVVLIILLIRGVTLPGAAVGLRFYLVPKWEKLLDITVWGEAAMQIFYSVGAAWGALVTMASYNKFHHDCYRDAKIVPILNCCTSIFAGFVIFSIIGFMAHETGSTIDQVVKQGPGLVFVVYPEAVARMPVSPLWAVLFFMMLFTIGLDSQFGMFETMTSAILDEFSWLRSKKLLVTAGLCFLEFLLGIPCIMQGGIYFLQIMDWYSATFSLMILSLTELVVLSWIYGVDRLYRDIELMIGYTPCAWWKICWAYITPTIIVILLIFNMVMHSPVTYDKYTYPGWAIAVGWVFALCSIVPLPLVAAIKIYKEEGTFLERIRKLIKPDKEWGPALERHRAHYLASLSPAEGGAPSRQANLEMVACIEPVLPCQTSSPAAAENDAKLPGPDASLIV